MALRDSDPLALDEPAGGGQDHPGRREEETEVRQPSSKVPFKVLRGHGEAVTSCHLCFDDSRLLTSSHDNTAIIWDTDRLVALQCYGGSHSAGISECALVPGTNRVILQAVLLLDVHCRPVKMGPYFMNNAGYTAGRSSQGPAFMVKGGSTGGGSYSQDPAFYRPEEPEAPEDYGTSSAAALPSGKSNSHPSLTDSSQAIAWVIPPSVYSGDSKSGKGRSASGSSPSNAMPGPQFIPGELLQLERTMDAGRFISETQEQGNPPPRPPPPFAVNTAPSNAMPGPQFIPGELLQLERTMDAGRFISETQERGNPPPPSPPPPQFAVNTVFNSPPAQEASIPSNYYGYFYPYDFMFVTGQYPPGTYAQARSSFEQGSDKFIENQYIRYDYPDSPGEKQAMQPYPSDAWQGMGKEMPNH